MHSVHHQCWLASVLNNHFNLVGRIIENENAWTDFHWSSLFFPSILRMLCAEDHSSACECIWYRTKPLETNQRWLESHDLARRNLFLNLISFDGREWYRCRSRTAEMSGDESAWWCRHAWNAKEWTNFISVIDITNIQICIDFGRRANRLQSAAGPRWSAAQSLTQQSKTVLFHHW